MKVTGEQICGWCGITRQAHHQKRHRDEDREAEAAVVIEEVLRIRQLHPRIGTRKLLSMMGGYLEEQEIQIGRDRFFELLGGHELLVPRKRKGTRTTFPGGIHSENLLASAVIEEANQAVVVDITYMDTEGGYLYLALVTDLYSRKIVGWDLSDSLRMEGALRALRRAVRHAGGDVGGLIHHGDHGVQYTSGAYLSYMKAHGIKSSMGEVGNAYDNAVAERVNGVLKIEYLLDRRFKDFATALKATRQAIELYNTQRPHWSLGLKIPAEVYASSTMKEAA